MTAEKTQAAIDEIERQIADLPDDIEHSDVLMLVSNGENAKVILEALRVYELVIDNNLLDDEVYEFVAEHCNCCGGIAETIVRGVTAEIVRQAKGRDGVVDYLANGLHHYSMYYFRSITMTTEKNKAALVQAYNAASDWLVKSKIEGERYPHFGMIEAACLQYAAALTAQAEAQPADDEVREAVKKKYWIMGTGVFHPIPKGEKVGIGYTSPHLICECKTVEQAHAIREEIIRAATAPKNTDAEREKALGAVSEWQIARATGCPDIEHEKATSMLKLVKSALQSPAAVPQDVVDILDQIRKSGFASYYGEKPHVLAVKALALLQQKGGDQ